VRRPEAERQEAADQRPDADEGHDQPPSGRTPEAPLGHEWAEHGDRREEKVAQGRPGHDRPYPGAAGERPPALQQVATEALRGPGRGDRRKPGEEARVDGEAQGVSGQSPAGTCRGDDHAGDRRPHHLTPRAGHGAERIRLLQRARPDSGWNETGDGGVEERHARAVRGLENEQLPELRGPGEDQGRGHRLGEEPHQIGRDHEQAPALHPIGDHPADQQQRHQGARAGGEHPAEVVRGSGELEHGEGKRDGCHPVAEE
jgi:hypothetical protein